MKEGERAGEGEQEREPHYPVLIVAQELDIATILPHNFWSLLARASPWTHASRMCRGHVSHK